MSQRSVAVICNQSTMRDQLWMRDRLLVCDELLIRSPAWELFPQPYGCRAQAIYLRILVNLVIYVSGWVSHEQLLLSWYPFQRGSTTLSLSLTKDEGCVPRPQPDNLKTGRRPKNAAPSAIVSTLSLSFPEAIDPLPVLARQP